MNKFAYVPHPHLAVRRGKRLVVAEIVWLSAVGYMLSLLFGQEASETVVEETQWVGWRFRSQWGLAFR